TEGAHEGAVTRDAYARGADADELPAEGTGDEVAFVVGGGGGFGHQQTPLQRASRVRRTEGWRADSGGVFRVGRCDNEAPVREGGVPHREEAHRYGRVGVGELRGAQVDEVVAV